MHVLVNFLGDTDEFSALKRYVQNVLDDGKLAAHVSVHNLNVVTSSDLPSLVYCIWPTPRKGYNASALFEIQRELRRKCQDHNPRIALIGHSTDSAGFSRSLAKQIMTPQKTLIEYGIISIE